jgi:hypothetical protein
VFEELRVRQRDFGHLPADPLKMLARNLHVPVSPRDAPGSMKVIAFREELVSVSAERIVSWNNLR